MEAVKKKDQYKQCMIAQCKQCGNVDMMVALPVADSGKKQLETKASMGYKVIAMSVDKAKDQLGCKCPVAFQAARSLKHIKKTLSSEDPEFVAAIYIPAVIESLSDVISKLEKDAC